MNVIKINRKRCKRCGICIEFCPAGLFDKEIDGTPIPQRVEACTGCRMCEMRCPDIAIKVEVIKGEKQK